MEPGRSSTVDYQASSMSCALGPTELDLFTGLLAWAGRVANSAKVSKSLMNVRLFCLGAIDPLQNIFIILLSNARISPG